MSTSSVQSGPRSARAGRVILLSMVGLMAALVALVWILPGMLDWNRYRGSIAGLVAAGIGRPVQIDGNITLHLLPQPILTASNIKVDDSGNGLVLIVHELRLRVALGPLLGGRVDARELILRGADLRLPWPPPAGALSRRPPAWLTGLQARVEESRLQVGGLVLSDIDASLGSDPDTGTLSAAGAAKIFGLAWRFTARLGRPGNDGAAPLDTSLDGQGKLRDTGGTFSGVLAADGALSGRLAARGPDLSQLMPAPAVAWRGDGRLSAASGLVVADELALEIGGSPARGAVALRVQPDLRLDVALAAGRLDLDGWLPALLRSAQPGKQASFPTGIDLSAEVASLAGGTVRRLRSALDLDADGVTVRDVTAMLPGDAQLSLRGHLPGRSRGTLFEGSAGLVAPDLRGTLRWLEPFAPALLHGLAADALRAGHLTANVTVDPAQLSFTDLKGTLDGAAVQGGLAVRLGPRLGISAGLSLDRLLLDPWLPDPAGLSDPAAAYARLRKSLAEVGFDADLKLQVRKAEWRGGEFGPVSLDMQSEAGHLTIRRFEATAAGVRATVSGTIGDGGRVSEGRVELAAQDAAVVRPYLPADLVAIPALLRGPATLLLQLAGPPDALAVRAALELSDLRAEAQPVLNLPGRRWSGAVTIHHPGAPRLLESLGVAGTASWLGDGSFSVIAQASAAPGRLELTNLELIAGALRASGQLVLAGPSLTGRIRAETLTLPPFYPRSPDPLPLGALRGTQAKLHLEAGEVLVGLEPTVQDLSAELSLQQGALDVSGLAAKLSGGTVEGSARFETGDKPRLAVQGQAKDIAVTGPLTGGALDVTSGQLQAQFDLAGEGYSPAALTATLAGTGSVRIREAHMTGFDLGAARAALADPQQPRLMDALRAALMGGSTEVSDLAIPFQARKGVLSIDAAGPAGPGTAALTGTLDLLGGALDGRLTLHPGATLPDLVVRLTGPALAPVRTPELASVARWLAERP